MADPSMEELIREAREKHDKRSNFLDTLHRKSKDHDAFDVSGTKENFATASDVKVGFDHADSSVSSQSKDVYFQCDKFGGSEDVMTGATQTFSEHTCDHAESLDESNLFHTFGTKIARRERSPSVDRVSIGRRTYDEAFGSDDDNRIIVEECQETRVVRRISQTSVKSSRHQSPVKSVLDRVTEAIPCHMSPKVRDIPFNKVSNIRAKFEGSQGSGSNSGHSSLSTTPKHVRIRKAAEGLRHIDSSFDDSTHHQTAINPPVTQIVEPPVALNFDTDTTDCTSVASRARTDSESAPPVPPHQNIAPQGQVEEPILVTAAPEHVALSVTPEPFIPSPATVHSPKPLKFFGSESNPQHSTPNVPEVVTSVTPQTPSRSGLIDEINADFVKFQQDSLPRGRGRDETDSLSTPLRSMQEYRQEMSQQMSQHGIHHPAREVTEVDSKEDKAKYVKELLKCLSRNVKIHTAQYDQAKQALKLILGKAQRDEDEEVAAHHVMLHCRSTVGAVMRFREIIELNPQAAILPDMKASFTFNQVCFEIHPEFQRRILIEPISCYFTVVISHRDTVRCSAYVSARKHMKGRVGIDMYTIIDGVGPGFEILVEVYMLKLAKKDDEKKSVMAEIVGTLLRGHGQRPEVGGMDCAFTRIGATKVDSSNMRSRHLRCETVQPLGSRIDLQYDFKLSETNHHYEGLVRRFEIVGGVGNWTNQYCVFANWHLSFWNSARDYDEKKPVNKVVNLKQAYDVTEVESLASYNNSFVISYKSVESDSDESVTLAACSKEQLDHWIRILDSYVRALNFWAST